MKGTQTVTTYRLGGSIEGAFINVVVISPVALLGLLGTGCMGHPVGRGEERERRRERRREGEVRERGRE